MFIKINILVIIWYFNENSHRILILYIWIVALVAVILKMLPKIFMTKSLHVSNKSITVSDNILVGRQNGWTIKWAIKYRLLVFNSGNNSMKKLQALMNLLHKTLHGMVAIKIPPYVQHKPVQKTRKSHPLKFLSLQSNCDTYKFSFWPRTIKDWNALPNEMLNITDSNRFKSSLI